ncbi:MAG: hypothetical protein F4Z35_02435 [Dehalococcoidia bacterium]|nr:hypothetical protein [Dehalococcoidia bacterium]
MLAEYHLEVSREFLIHAREQLEPGNNLQASEKGWGAAAYAVKALAERRGWRHRSHSDLFVAVRRIADTSGRPEVIELFGAANALHQNFNEGWLDDEYVAISLDRLERLLETLDEAT